MEGIDISNFSFIGNWEAIGIIDLLPSDERDYKESYLKFNENHTLVLILIGNDDRPVIKKGTWHKSHEELSINLMPFFEKTQSVKFKTQNIFYFSGICCIRILNSYLEPYLQESDSWDRDGIDDNPQDEEDDDTLDEGNAVEPPTTDNEGNNNFEDNENNDVDTGKDSNGNKNQFEEFYKNYLRLMGKQKSNVIEILKVNPKNSASSNPLLFNLYDDKINKVAIWFEKLKASYEQASLVEIYLSNKISQKSVLQELKNKYEYLVGTTASRKGWYHYFTRYNGNAVNIYYIPDYHEVVFDFYDMKDFTPGKYRN